MLVCPNKNDRVYKLLEKHISELEIYQLFINNGYELPSIGDAYIIIENNKLKSKETKPLVSENKVKFISKSTMLFDNNVSDLQQIIPNFNENVKEEYNKFINTLPFDILSDDLKNNPEEMVNEENQPCAEKGLKTEKFTPGSKWTIIQDLKGMPSHKQGGVDLKIGKDGLSFTRNNVDIKAKYGLVFNVSKSKLKAENGMVVPTDPPTGEDTYRGGSLPEVTVKEYAPRWLNYRREYRKNNPFNIDEYVQQRFDNPVGRKEKIAKIDEEGFRKSLREEGIIKYGKNSNTYVAERLLGDNPLIFYNNRQEWLDSFSPKELEIIRDSKLGNEVKPRLWSKFEQGLLSIGNGFSPVIQLKNENLSQQEAYQENNPLNIALPLTIPGKLIQSTYKQGYTAKDAIQGVPNDASMLEDIITDLPLDLLGLGTVTKFGKLGKLGKLDNVSDVGKLDNVSDISDVGKSVKSEIDWGKDYFSKIQAKSKELQKLIASKKITENDYLEQFQLYENQLRSELNLGKHLGGGMYGQVFELADNSSKALKLGRPYGTGWTPEIIEDLKSVKQNSNISIPEKVDYYEIPAFNKYYSPTKAEAMLMPNLNNVEAVNLNLSKRDRYAYFLKQARQLRDKGIKLDVDNHANFKFNENKGVYDIYDINPGYISNPVYYLNNVRDKTEWMRFKNGGYIGLNFQMLKEFPQYNKSQKNKEKDKEK